MTRKRTAFVDPTTQMGGGVNTTTLGRQGEELTAQALAAGGYKILLRNYECFLGEIDLIAKHRGALVFVEVKTRSSGAMGAPEEAVDHHKRGQIVRVARYYLKRYGILDARCRFDVVSVTVPETGPPEIRIIQAAFEA